MRKNDLLYNIGKVNKQVLQMSAEVTSQRKEECPKPKSNKNASVRRTCSRGQLIGFGLGVDIC